MKPPEPAPRRRPPWWPADEPWPPTGPPRWGPPWAWHTRRGPFLWRLGFILALFVLLAFTAVALLVWLIAGAIGVLETPRGLLVLRPFSIAIGVMLVLVAVRVVRRTALPIAELLHAANHVAEGDYSTRVAERGPREVRQLARAFNSMSARLQESDAQRRTLIADVTHELRTPLTVIQGNLEGLIDGVYPADHAHLTPILDETRVLARLIDDLRTLSLAESGALKLQKEPTDLAALASETIASFRPQADATGVKLEVQAGANLPLTNVEPARIREVVENLLANALRYTPRGGSVCVRCSVDVTPNSDQQVVLAVTDSGSGIAPEDLPRIFDRFYRAAGSPGMGLGLAISRDLVEAHGGTIEARSQRGQGTTIECRLPTSPPP